MNDSDFDFLGCSVALPGKPIAKRPIKKELDVSINESLDFAIQFLQTKEVANDKEKKFTDAEKRDIINKALENYVERTKHTKKYILDHKCGVGECHHDLMTVKYFENGHICTFGSNIVICQGPLACPSTTNKKYIKCLWSEDRISECSKTGRIHLCDASCKYQFIDSRNSVKSCRLTGLSCLDYHMVFADESEPGMKINYSNAMSKKEFIAGLKIFEQNAGPYIIKPPFILSQWIDILLNCKNNYETNKHIADGIKSNATKDEKYLLVACGKLWYLFCKEKYDKERLRYKRVKKNINGVIQTKINTHDQLRAHGYKTFLMWNQLYIEKTKLEKKSVFKIHFLYGDLSNKKERESTAAFLFKYAEHILKLWILLQGITEPGTFDNYSDFVLPSAYVMKEGIVFSSENANFIILPSDELLKQCLPEEQTLNEMLGLKNCFMEICLGIKSAFLAAINKQVSINELQLENIIIEEKIKGLENITKSNSITNEYTTKKRKRNCD